MISYDNWFINNGFRRTYNFGGLQFYLALILGFKKTGFNDLRLLRYWSLKY